MSHLIDFDHNIFVAFIRLKKHYKLGIREEICILAGSMPNSDIAS